LWASEAKRYGLRSILAEPTEKSQCPSHDVQRDRRAAWRIVSFSLQTGAGSLFFWERTEIERLAVVGCPQLISGENGTPDGFAGHKDVGENLAELSQTA
jgi:hypothetical protein